MATIYNFEVRAVSAFLAHDPKTIQSIIRKALEEFRDPKTGLTLESIEVKAKVGLK